MSISISSPTTVEVPEAYAERVRPKLTYNNTSIAYQYSQAKSNRGLLYALGTEAYQERLNELKAAIKTCLLKQREDGTFYALSGLATKIAELTGETVVNNVSYPERFPYVWATEPNKLRPYQKLALDKLLEAKHAAVQIGTGLGKTLIIEYLVKEHGLQTVIMTPSVSIATQIYSACCAHFGKKLVGAFFDGTKQYKKKIIVAVAQSLARVVPDSVEWKALSAAQVFIADESHQCPAETLSKVCTGLISNAPYRYFFSGTQTRGDGADLLLEGIIGPIVYRMTVQEGVEQGWLSKPVFKMIELTSSSTYDSADVKRMIRKHHYYNDKVLRKAASIANNAYRRLGHRVLILIDEIEQFVKLEPYLEHPFAFAHGGVTADNADKLPVKYHKSNPQELVDQFNKMQLPILIGTSCIATGTDILPCQTVIFLMGGTSEVKFKQAVGRGTRVVPGYKNSFHFFDFDITNIDTLHRHANIRADYMHDIYPSVERVAG